MSKVVNVDYSGFFDEFYDFFLPRTPVSTDNTTKHTDYGPHYI
jgi:hypothetical protein